MNSLCADPIDEGEESLPAARRVAVAFFVVEAHAELARTLAARLAAAGYRTTVESTPRSVGLTQEAIVGNDVIVVSPVRLAGMRKRQLARLLRTPRRGSLLLLTSSADLLDAVALVGHADALAFTDFGLERIVDIVEIARIGYTALPRALMETMLDRRLRDMAVERLAPRERRVLELLAAASSNRDIGSAFGIREGTAKALVRRVLAKLGFRNRTEAAVYAFRQGRDRPRREPGRRRGRSRAKRASADAKE